MMGFWKKADGTTSGSRGRRSRNRPVLECLERRELLTTGTQPYLLTGDRWSNESPVTFSIADDGVMWDRKANDLNATMDARFAAAGWQDEIARALQTWASVANIDFARVADSALAFDTYGQAQGDARFGDIRFGGYDFGHQDQLAHAYTPPPNGSTGAGDVVINTAMNFQIESDYDLFSVMLHETGHSLGLEHPDNSDAVMYQNYGGVQVGPAADDIAGIRAIYGVRADDLYGQQGRGSGFSDAVPLATSPVSPSRVDLEDLTLTTIGDSDYFSYVPATGGTLQVAAITEGVSLLSPQVSVYDASQALLVDEGSPSEYGQDVSASVAEVTAGRPYYIKVSGATGDVFSIGAYDLDVSLEGGQPNGTTGQLPPIARVPAPLPTPPTVTPPPTTSPAPPTVTPPVPPTVAWTPSSNLPSFEPPWRKHFARLPVAWQRRILANARGRARAAGEGREGSEIRVSQVVRSLVASEVVAMTSRPVRRGRLIALRLPA